MAMFRIKALREKNGVSQTDLSRKSGISQPYLCDLENNRRGAKPGTLQRIADALGVTVDELKGEEQKAG